VPLEALDPDEATPPPPGEQRFVVGEVVVWNLVVHAETRVLGEVDKRVVLRVPGLRLTGIGEQSVHGIRADQLVASVLEGVCRHVYATGSQHLPPTIARRFNEELLRMDGDQVHLRTPGEM